MKAATCPVNSSPCLPPRSRSWVIWSSGPAVPLRFRVFLAMPQGYPNAATAIGRYDDDKTGAGSRRPGGRAGPASGNRPGQLPLVVQSSSHDSSARLGAAVTRRRHSRRGRQDRCFHREAALCLKHGCRTARLSQPRARSTLGGARPDAALMGTEHSPRRGRAHGSGPERRASMRFRDARSSKEQRRGVRVPRLRRCPVVVLSGPSLISDARCEDGEPISPRSPRTARRRLPWACDHRRR